MEFTTKLSSIAAEMRRTKAAANGSIEAIGTPNIRATAWPQSVIAYDNCSRPKRISIELLSECRLPLSLIRSRVCHTWENITGLEYILPHYHKWESQKYNIYAKSFSIILWSWLSYRIDEFRKQGPKKRKSHMETCQMGNSNVHF